MLELNKPIHTDDPYRLLQYEHGTFEIVSPNGERLCVVAPLTPADSGNLKPTEKSKTSAGWWRIRKIAPS